MEKADWLVRSLGGWSTISENSKNMSSCFTRSALADQTVFSCVLAIWDSTFIVIRRDFTQHPSMIHCM